MGQILQSHGTGNSYRDRSIPRYDLCEISVKKQGGDLYEEKTADHFCRT